MSNVAATVEFSSIITEVVCELAIGTAQGSGQDANPSRSRGGWIQTSQSCGVAVPLTAVLYSSAGTVVQVIRRDRVETKQVEVGLMSGGQVEIRDGLAEGDMVVARAGALLREGDPVRPETAGVEVK